MAQFYQVLKSPAHKLSPTFQVNKSYVWNWGVWNWGKYYVCIGFIQQTETDVRMRDRA